jgi:hypothetical protein
MNNRLETLCDRLLALNQTALMKVRYILESVVSTQEIIHDALKSGHKGLMLKLDYEKTYDRVDWQFLEEMLRSRGFSVGWIDWAMSLVKGSLYP